MEQTEQINELATALAAATAEFLPIVAARTADIAGREGRAGYRYKYATLQDCIAACRPALSTHQLAVVQMLDTTPEGFSAITTQLVHSSGQWIRSHFLVPVTDAREARAIGSGLSYARRYAYCAIIGVAVEEEDDDAAAAKAPRQQTARPDQRPAQRSAAPTGQRDPSEYRFASGAFRGKTVQEAWDSGEAGQEFVQKCARPGNGPAFIREQAQKVIKAAIDAESTP
jgi:hypothetical protein